MRLRTGIALGLTLALGLTACGEQGGEEQVATAGGRPSATSTATGGGAKPGDFYEGSLRYAQCMREHGVDMPDPSNEEGGGISIMVPKGTDKAKVEAADKACKQYLPNGGVPEKLDPQALERARQMSKCVREHGFPDFPDPDENGGIRFEAGSGFDPKDPKLMEAQKACGGPGGRITSKTEGGE